MLPFNLQEKSQFTVSNWCFQCDLEHKFDEDLLRELRRLSLEKGGSGGNPITLYNSLTGCSQVGIGVFSLGDKTRGNSFKLCQGRFRLDIRKKFLTERVAKPWYRLPSGGITVSGSTYKSCGCGPWGLSLSVEHGGAGLTVGLNDLGGVFQAQWFHDCPHFR